jgi:hypothetical protein
MTVISITQIDIALFSLLVAEATSFYTNRLLLNEKTFAKPGFVELAKVEEV